MKEEWALKIILTPITGLPRHEKIKIAVKTVSNISKLINLIISWMISSSEYKAFKLFIMIPHKNWTQKN